MKRHQPLQHDRLCGGEGYDRGDRALRQGADWACTIAELEKTKNVDTGVMAPISFGPGVRFSNQKAADHAGRVLDAEFQP